MPVPTFDKFIEPVLRILAAHPDGISARDAHHLAADHLGLSEGDRAELLPSKKQQVYKNRAGWAHDRLKRAGYSASVKLGQWQLTPAGQEFASAHPQGLSVESIRYLASSPHVTSVTAKPGTASLALPQSQEAPIVTPESPDDRLERALAEIRTSVAGELLEALAKADPKRFELIVLDVLYKIGYGISPEDIRHVGKPGDGGIDGIISLDRLGFEKVYVQAKRWQNSIGGPDVQAFYGALAGQKASKGVFITTASFTPAATEYARSVDRIVLVDGERLANLMIDYEVGVSLRPLHVPKLDGDYFEL